MANPFGGFGGQQNVFGSVAQQQQTSPFAGSTAPVFGQHAFGQSTSTTTSSFTSNVFGQTGLQSSPQSGLFSNQPTNSAASTAASSSVFGKPSVFGQNTSQSGNQLGVFSNQVDNSSTGAAKSAFGQVPAFGQTSTAKNVFGSPTFGAATSGNPVSSSSSSGLFTSRSTLPSPSLFGGPTSKPQSSSFSNADASQASSPFGGPGSTGYTSTTSSGPFGNVPASSSGLFARPSNTASAFTASTGFHGVKKEPGIDSKSGMFGGQGTGIKTEPTNLFGKVYKEERSTVEAGSKPVGSSVFGGVKIKHEDGGAVQKELFGKRTTGERSKQPAGLFGKGKQSAHLLFGKTVTKNEDTEKTDNTPEDSEEDNSSRGSYTTESKSIASRGQRGQPSTSSEGKTASSTRLFGKSPVSRKRVPSSSEDARPSTRRQISEEIGTKLAIVCKNIPHKYNNTMHLKSHFKRYGEVTKVFPSQAKMQATIHFKTHTDAAEAKRRGRTLAPGIEPMTIFWSSYAGPGTQKVTKSTTASEPRTARSLKRTSDSELIPRPKRTSIKSENPLHEELEGMAGTSDTRGHSREPKRSPERRNRTVSPTPSTSSTSLDSKNVQSQMFQGATARTTTERVHMLELRDKFIRQNRVKQKKDIETAKAFVGTCPDMCPEKERYDREDKRRLSYYEIIPGTENISGKNPLVDHSRAVKEYLRSSPDQDEPLPHELRPIKVLLSTMTFLLTEVADKGGDGHWADWFDYLWNRTRGIRKDVTQQQLNDRDAVDLIEKCARFHIYCSERLCEEDMHTFDSKINDENLTKCLQTLKEFYADLEKKQKCFCENEAEFRAYMVLMNLNEGDTLREVQQLRPGVRTSQAVKFALQTYFALNGNNYIKFFRLVKQASFTNACIMHRYFTQVRNKALTTMMRGFSIGSRPAQIPLSEMVRLLGYESENEASDFCQHYGFNITDREVILDKSEYIEPETAWSPLRSVNLIESRLMVSVGELINGEAFNNVQHLTPVSSFDENDKFWSSIPLPSNAPEPRASVRPVEERPPVPTEVRQEPATVVAQQEEARQKAKISVEVLKDTAKFLFWDVIEGMCQDIGFEVKSEVDSLLFLSEELTHEILNVVLHEETSHVIKDVLEEAHALRRKQLQEELEARRDRVAVELTNEIIYDLVWQEAKNLSTIKMREVKAQLKQECIERSTAAINAELVEEVMNEMVADVSEDVFETDVRQRLKQLDDFEKIVKLGRARKFWVCWKKEYSTLIKLKRGMEEFPCAPNMQSNRDVLRSLIPVEDDRIVDKKFYISKRAKLTLETPLEICARRKETDTYVMVHDLYSKLLYQSAWTPLDLGKLVGKQLSRRQKFVTHSTMKVENMSWKLLLCLPDYDDDSSATTQSGLVTKSLCKWLKVKLSKGMTPPASRTSIKSEVLSLYKCYVSDETSTKSTRPVGLNVCVRTLQGTLDIDDITTVDEERLLLGTNALLFVLPAGAQLDKTKSAEYRQYWSAQFSRLKSILQVNPKYQRFPLVVLMTTAANENVSYKQVQEGLHFNELMEEDLLCDAELLTYETDTRRLEGIDLVKPSVSEQLCRSIQWLAGNTRPVSKLEVKFLKVVINDTLQKFYFSPSQQNLKKRKLLDTLEKEPGSLLELYNNVVIHIGSALTSDTIYKISWPVYEYADSLSTALPPCHWNKGDHLEYVYGLIESLKLPEFPPLPLVSENWEEVKTAIWSFVSSFADNESSVARVILFSRLKKLLHNLEVDFEEACNFQYGEADCQPTCYNVPWTTVISMCVDYKLDSINLIDYNYEESGQELKVAYIKEEMEKFVVPDSWKYVESDVAIQETPCLDDTIYSAVVKSREMKDNSLRDISIENDPSNVPVIAVETRKMADSVKEALKSERRHSDHFMRYLENALQDGEMDTSVSSVSVFEPVTDRRMSFPSARRKSDLDLFGASQLPPGKKRRARLSEVFSNDPVMMYVNEPSLTEDLDSLKENIKSERRQSDLFTQRLQLIMQSQSDSF